MGKTDDVVGAFMGALNGPVVTDEAVQDMQALFTGMTHEQFKEFVLNSITANGARSLEITKEIKQSADKRLRESFTLLFKQ